MSGALTVLILLGLVGAGLVGLLAPSPLPDPSPRWPLIVAYPIFLAFILLLIAAVRIQYSLEQFTGPRRKLRLGDVVKERDFNLSAFLQTQRDHSIKNVTFERCTIRGPALVTVVGSIELIGCGFRGGGKPDDLIIEIAESRSIAGIGAFVHCKFLNCEFHNIAWIVGKPMADKMRAMAKV